MTMRLSAIQKDLLFVLVALEGKGMSNPVPAMRLCEMINAVRVSPVMPGNFRASCHTLVRHGMLLKYSSPSLHLGFVLTESGRITGSELLRQRSV